ncbi:MAG: hypothetical protein GY762_04750 [Proteobacteria bacterium]|nr:hypothetical protein [Pseudomonadota bacterium]
MEIFGINNAIKSTSPVSGWALPSVALVFSIIIGTASAEPPPQTLAGKSEPAATDPVRGEEKNAPQWKLKRQENGVTIYLRKVEDSPVLQVRAIKKMKTSLTALVALIKDSHGRQHWIYKNKIAKKIEQRSNFEWISYKEMKAPWPVSNRDMIIHSKLSQDPETYAVRIDSVGVPDFLPKKKRIVRVPKLVTSWEFIPKRDGMVEVRFKLAIELGGHLPAWLVNTSIDRGPYETILGMAKFVKKRRYRKAKIPYIKELPVE